MKVTDVEDDDCSSCDDSISPSSDIIDEEHSHDRKKQEEEIAVHRDSPQRGTTGRTASGKREILRTIIDRYYAPVLMKPMMKVVIVSHLFLI